MSQNKKASNNLLKQAKSIKGVDNEQVMALQAYWINKGMERIEFICKLNERLGKVAFLTRKDRSQAYSKQVIEYDKAQSSS